MKELIKAAIKLALNFIPGASLIEGIAFAIVDSLNLKTQGQGQAVLAIVSEHLTVFDLAIKAAGTPDLLQAARVSFELGLTRALRDAGFLETVGE